MNEWLQNEYTYSLCVARLALECKALVGAIVCPMDDILQNIIDGAIEYPNHVLRLVMMWSCLSNDMSHLAKFTNNDHALPSKLYEELNVLKIETRRIIKHVSIETIDTSLPSARDTNRQDSTGRTSHTSRTSPSDFSSFADTKRISSLAQNHYNRTNNFPKCLDQYQGKQGSVIDNNILKSLEKRAIAIKLVPPIGPVEMTKRERFARITPAHIIRMASDIGLENLEGRVNLIHHILTDQPCIDLVPVEDQLIADFVAFSTVFDQFKTRNAKFRKNFINTDYVLWRLLKKNGHNGPEPATFKTLDRALDHINTCNEIFSVLGWNM
jgi:hypothetical protein